MQEQQRQRNEGWSASRYQGRENMLESQPSPLPLSSAPDPFPLGVHITCPPPGLRFQASLHLQALTDPEKTLNLENAPPLSSWQTLLVRDMNRDAGNYYVEVGIWVWHPQ